MSTKSVLDSFIVLRRTLANLRAAATKSIDMGHSQITVLYILSVTDATMGELVERTLSDKAAMSRTISSLVEQGLVDRVSDPTDKRVTRIKLTAKGKEKAQIAKKVRATIEKRLESALTAKERSDFSALVHKIEAHLREN